jgi:DHA1 family multidrug resistance protein-like MFS transporter
MLSIMSFSLGLPFMAFYLREFGVTDVAEIKYYIGILAAAPAFSMALMAPIWGILGDKYGKKIMLLRAMFAGSLVLVGMGLATDLQLLLILRISQGLFTGTITAANTLVASQTPQDRMSFALGFLSSSNFIGMAIGPTIGGYVGELIGYRVSFFAGGALMLMGFLLVLFLVKEEKREKVAPLDNRIGVHKIIGVFTPTIVITLFIILCLNTVRSIFSPYMPLFVQQMLGTMVGAPRITGLISTITALMVATAGLTLSRLGDRFDKFMILKRLMLGSLLMSLIVSIPDKLTMFIIVYALLFLMLGGIEPIVMTITVKDIPPELRGMIFGFIGVVVNLGLGISPLIGGWVSIKYDLHAILYLFPLFISISLIPVLLLTSNNLLKRSKNQALREPSTTTSFRR